jgi:hypothetical protein
MGKKKASPAPAPPPPAPAPVAVPTQSLQTQTALNEVSGAQSRLNMTLGAQLDQQNKAFFTTQDIRQTQATGAETRLTLGTQGEQERATTTATGEQQRLGYQTQGKETRKTALQQNMQQNYVAGRQHDWAQDAYRMGGPSASQPSSAQPGLVE